MNHQVLRDETVVEQKAWWPMLLKSHPSTLPRRSARCAMIVLCSLALLDHCRHCALPSFLSWRATAFSLISLTHYQRSLAN